MIVTAENLQKTYGIKTLFSNVTFTIDEGDRIGIVGVNGTGKSTLARTIAGVTIPDNGTLTIPKGVRVEYLAQDAMADPERTVLAEAFRGTHPVMQALRDYETALAQSERDRENPAIQEEILRCSRQIDAYGAWQYESDAKTILTQLDIVNFSAKAGALSGGEQKRLALASALIQPAELLILDEPTNHLDSITIEWLEAHLRRRKGALLLVTHDRYFLDRTVNQILELDGGRAFAYPGNYTKFLEGKAEREEREAADERKRRSLLRTELAWMQRGAQARSTKQKARIERFETLKGSTVSEKEEALEIALGGSRLGRTVIELDKAAARFGDKTVLEPFTYVLLKRDRIGIVGPNGAGKSTLLNLLAGKIAPASGTATIGQTVKIGYFSQVVEAMDEWLTAIEYIREEAHYVKLADGSSVSASQLMERFLFPREMQWTPVAKLSGGEKRRLFLLRILMGAPNVLLLDEPTNDLDLQTLAVLEEFLDGFPGAVVFASHDRFFTDRLAEKVFVLNEGRIRQYAGGYSDYKRVADAEDATRGTEERAKEKKTVAERTPAERKRRLSFKEQREYEEIEAVIQAAEGELKATRLRLVDAGSDFTAAADLAEEEQRLEARLAELVDRWAYLEEIAGGE